MNKHICIVAEHYPTDLEPDYPFVQQLAYSLSNEGITCSVIAPQSITRNIIRGAKFKPVFSKDISPDGKIINVYRPYYFTISNFPFQSVQKSVNTIMGKTIKKIIEKICPDVVYCYFWHIALTVANASIPESIPIYVQASECSLTIPSFLLSQKNLNRIKGAVCASEKNKQESITANLISPEKTKVVVNGYRKDEFFPMDKQTARSKYGFNSDDFIVIFVGGFIERKGIKELSMAINRIDGIKSIFVGRGNLKPQCHDILFEGPVPHNKLCSYLNCADIFVLPTKAEGCCNAIIEALACGLPVVSSNKSFNNDTLNDKCSIRLDETNVDEIEQAIILLKDNPDIRNKMSKEAIEQSRQLTVEVRAKRIIDFIFNNEKISSIV